MSRRLGEAAHLLDPRLENPPGVVRPGAGLRMELHRPRPLAAQLQPLDGAVVQRDMRLLARLGRRDGETVVLRSDEDAVRASLEHRMVSTAVAERELVRLAPGRDRQQLVAEADPEDRDPSDQVAQCYLLVLERRGIAGAV